MVCLGEVRVKGEIKSMVRTETDSAQADWTYFIEEIRSNLSVKNSRDHFARAQAWLLTLLSLYGDAYGLLIDLYRLFREYQCYSLLSFLVEYLLQHQSNQLEHDQFFRDEFQKLFKRNSEENRQLYSLLSSTSRDLISSFLFRQWFSEFEESLPSAMTSIDSLKKCREKARACLSLSSSSSSVLQMIRQTEEKFRPSTSLNTLRCLFVEELLRLALENPSPWNVPLHQCHRWLIDAMEFYLEYSMESFKKNPQMNLHLQLEGTKEMYQCDQPIKRFEQLVSLALEREENFQWKDYSVSSNIGRQEILQLRLLLDRNPSRPIRCPLECFLFCRIFPIFTQSMLRLSSIFAQSDLHSSLFLYATRSIRQRNPIDSVQLELNEEFYLLFQCLTILQEEHQSIQIYHELIEKIHLSSSISIYSRLLKYFFFYYRIEQVKIKRTRPKTKTIVIDDTPQSPPMVTETSPMVNPFVVPDIDQWKFDSSLESRLQLCYLYSINASSIDQRRTTIDFCLDTLFNLDENLSKESFISICTNYALISPSSSICFDYLIDLLLEHLSPTLILLQVEHENEANFLYPSELFPQFSSSHLRFIFDRNLLNQWLKYIQKSSDANRRWPSQISKRKLNEDDARLNDEQLIEKILQHVSHLNQINGEERRTLLRHYLHDERLNLHPKENHPSH